jgi:neopullulanase
MELVSEAGKRNIKVIKDMIFNHCGSNHWWIKDLPSGDWVHQWPEYTKTHYRGTTIVDPHVAQSDLDVMLKGWFDRNMPDLNQRNRLLATYLIQNSIWWVEFSGIKGIRMDTQPYPYKEFMAEWAERVMTEYPNFTLVGEAWMPKASLVSYYQRNVMNHDGYNSHLPAVFDFPLYYAINKAFNEEAGWDTGLIRLYDALTEDFLYSDPYRLVVFGDNHDLGQAFYQSGRRFGQTKNGDDFPAYNKGNSNDLLRNRNSKNRIWKVQTMATSGLIFRVAGQETAKMHLLLKEEMTVRMRHSAL